MFGPPSLIIRILTWVISYGVHKGFEDWGGRGLCVYPLMNLCANLCVYANILY